MQLKRSRRTAIVLATCIIFAILSFVFGYIQKQEADRLMTEVEKCKSEAEMMRQLATANEMRAVQCESRIRK